MRVQSWDDIPDKKKGAPKTWADIPGKPTSSRAAASWDDIPDEKPPAPKKQPFSLTPPPSMRLTKEEATARVLRAQAEDRARQAKAAPKKQAGSFVDLSPPKYTKEQIEAPPAQQLKMGAAGAAEAVAGMASGAPPPVQKMINRVGTVFHVARDLLNKLADEKGRLSARYGGSENVPFEVEWEGIKRGFRRWAPWETFKRSFVKGEATDEEILLRLASGDRKMKAALDKIGGPAVGDFLLSFAVDAGPGKLQGLAVGKLARYGPKLQAVAERKIPALGRKLATDRAYRETQRAYSMQGAKAERHARTAADIAEDVKRTTQKARKGGAKVRTIDPVTRKPVNEVDRLVADYVEAGSPGSRHAKPGAEVLDPVLAQARTRGGAVARGLVQREAAAADEAVGVLESAKQKGKGAIPKAVAQGRGAAQREAAAADEAAARLEGIKGRGREAVRGIVAGAERERAAGQELIAAAGQRGRARAGEMVAAGAAEAARPGQVLAQVQARARSGMRGILRDIDLRDAADAAAVRQYDEFANLIRQGRLPKAELGNLLAEMKQAGRDAVMRALERGEAIEDAAAAAAEASRQRLLLRVQAGGRKKVQAILAAGRAEADAQGTLLGRLAAGGRRGVDEMIDRGRAAVAQERQAAGGRLLSEAMTEGAAGRVIDRMGVAGRRGVAAARAQGAAQAQEEAGSILAGAIAEARGAAAVERGGQAAAQRVDDLIQGTAPTERGARVETFRTGAAARRAEELVKVADEARGLGIDPEDIARIGERYRALGDEIGQELVDVGALSQEAFERLRGFHLPRYYLLRSSKPKEAERLLAEMERKGMIGAEAAGEIRRGWDKTRRGGRDFSAAREIEEFSERQDPALGRVVAPGATPAFARYTQSATREIGEQRALQEIAQNPELAVRRANATPEQQRLWKELPDLKDHLVHPGVARFVEVRNQALKQPETWAGEQWVGANRIVRRWWMSAPRSAANNAGGNFALGHAGLNVSGVERSLSQSALGYGAAMKELRQAEKTGKASPVLQEFRETFPESASLIPPEARSFTSGFGVETAAERLRAAPGQILRYEHPVQQAYAKALLRDPEEAARFWVYRELRRSGKSVREARDITQAVMIDYSATGPLIQWAERNNISPFITFPLRAVFQYANTAVRRPDIAQTLMGERLRVLADQLADEASGGKARARERRRKGEVSLMEFPLPGMMDEQGQQRYWRAPLLAPMLQLFPVQPDASEDPITGIVKDRVKSALPFFRVPLELATDRVTYTGKPIVPPGLSPGSPDALTAQGSHLLRSFLPFWRDLETGYHAATGTTPYASPFVGTPKPQDAPLSFLLGVREKEGTGDTSLQGRERAAARMEDPEHQPYRQHSDEYKQALEEGRVQVDPRLQEGVRKKYRKLHEAGAALKDAVLRHVGLLTTKEKSGEDRIRAIEGQLQLIRALEQVVRELEAQDQSVGALGQ